MWYGGDCGDGGDERREYAMVKKKERKRKEYYLSKSDIDELIERIRLEWGMDIKKPKRLKVIEVDDHRLLLDDSSDDGLMVVMKSDDDNTLILPFLAATNILQLFPSVTVDMGAIEHICNGADVMRPGIVSMDDFTQGDLVTVKDSRYAKYIAVGVALLSSDDARSVSRGAIVKNMHYVGDIVWEECKDTK
jgi:PUA domain protein